MMVDKHCVDRAFDALSESFDAWMESEVKLETGPGDALGAWIGCAALMTANILKVNVREEGLENITAVSAVRFLDNLRLSLEGLDDAIERHDTLGRGNGNGAHSDSS